MAKHKAAIVTLKPDLQRIIAALVVAMNDRAERHMSTTQYDLLKTLFYADREHLNRYGRPITFDNYLAMKYGPVASTAYDILKDVNCQGYLKQAGQVALPWTIEKHGNTLTFSNGSFDAVEDILAPSDIDAIKNTNTKLKGMSFRTIKDMTHADPAYCDAWDPAAPENTFNMSLGLFFDTPNFARAEELADLTKL